MSRYSRRRFLRNAGGIATVTTVASGSAAGSSDRRDGWQLRETPTSNALFDVTIGTDGALAVGGSGTILERIDGEWRSVDASLPGRPGANLAAVDATDDGTRVWFVGASGAVGEYDVTSDELRSHSAPDGIEGTFTSVSAVGDAVVHVGDDSGRIHTYATGNGWTHVIPGSGSTIRALAFAAPDRGFALDSNHAVFAYDGEAWTQIGIADADHALYDVCTTSGAPQVAGDAIYARASGSWSPSDGTWSRANPAEQTLHAIETGPCGCAHAVGASGVVLHRPGHGIPAGPNVARWLDLWTQSTPVEQNLHGIAFGARHVAVGAAGTVIERSMG